MAGLRWPPKMGVCNATKQEVATIGQALEQDLSQVTQWVRACGLWPLLVPAGIHQSQGNRTVALSDAGDPLRAASRGPAPLA